MGNFFCSRKIHFWKYSRERYSIKNSVNTDTFNLEVRTCKKCGKKQVYAIIYALRDSKKYWRDWDRKDGDFITWEDLS